RKAGETLSAAVDPGWITAERPGSGPRSPISTTRLSSPCRGKPYVIAVEVDDSAPTVSFLSFVPERRPRLPAGNPAEQWLFRDGDQRDFTTVHLSGGKLNPDCGDEADCQTPRENAEVIRDYWLMTTEVSRAMVRRYHWLQTSGFPPEIQGADLKQESADRLSPYRFDAADQLALPDDFPAV